jgi:putative colanic acid biosynthesis glycosyltransferase
MSDINQKPLISVITICLNAVDFIKQTIKSVIAQTYPNIEYIVIDGGSRDGTVDIICRYDTVLAYWQTEMDLGIYDAMNKGISRSHGKWIYFLGAGDYFYNNTVIESIFDKKINMEKYELIFGDIIYNNSRLFKSTFGPLLKLKNTIHHQGAFYRSDIFTSFRYDSNLKALADYELNLKLYLSNCNVFKINMIISNCMEGGISGQAKFNIYKEEIKIRKQYFSFFERSIYNLSSIARFLYKKIKVIRRNFSTHTNDYN